MSAAELAEKLEAIPIVDMTREDQATFHQAIARLRSMEEALKPFAKIADRLEDEGNEAALCAYDDKDMYERPISVGHFRKARAALSGEGQ